MMSRNASGPQQPQTSDGRPALLFPLAFNQGAGGIIRGRERRGCKVLHQGLLMQISRGNKQWQESDLKAPVAVAVMWWGFTFVPGSGAALGAVARWQTRR